MTNGPPRATLAALDARRVTETPLRGLNDGAWALRLGDGTDAVATRATEQVAVVATVAGESGVGAPVIAFCDGWLVCSLLRGERVAGPMFGRPSVLNGIAELLSRLHAMPVDLEPASLSESLREYASASINSCDRSQARAIEWADREAEKLAQTSTGEVPCHLDAAANMMATRKGLRLIDFDYAAMADPAQELGQVIWEAELGPKAANELIARYEGFSGRRVAEAATWSVVVGVSWTAWAASRPGRASALYSRRCWERVRTHWALPDHWPQ